MPSICHVIPCMNSVEYTRLLLDSLFKHTPRELLGDIIIVDNGSVDGTSNLIEEYDIVTVIRNKKNEGFPKAVNQGILLGFDHEFIAVWNNDMEVSPYCIESLLANTDGYGMISADFYEPPQMSAEDFRKDVKSNPEGKVLDFGKGAPWLFKSEVFKRIGLFDERFFPTQCEDTDFLLRMSLAKMKHGILSSAWCYHYGSITQKKELEPLYGGYSYAADNRRKFEEKWQTMHIDMKQAYETGDHVNRTRH